MFNGLKSSSPKVPVELIEETEEVDFIRRVFTVLPPKENDVS